MLWRLNQPVCVEMFNCFITCYDILPLQAWTRRHKNCSREVVNLISVAYQFCPVETGRISCELGLESSLCLKHGTQRQSLPLQRGMRFYIRSADIIIGYVIFAVIISMMVAQGERDY